MENFFLSFPTRTLHRKNKHSKMDKLSIKEAIVVEGRDDAAVVSQITDALIIQTHGFGISGRTWKLLEKAYREKGLIIFTDPDFAGEQIRKRIEARFPESKHAYMPRKKAVKNGDIGIENVSPQDAARVLERVCSKKFKADGEGQNGIFTAQDIDMAGLSGGKGSKELRQKVGDILSIGYGNSGAFLRKLNSFAITREAFEKAVAEAKGSER